MSSLRLRCSTVRNSVDICSFLSNVCVVVRVSVDDDILNVYRDRGHVPVRGISLASASGQPLAAHIGPPMDTRAVIFVRPDQRPRPPCARRTVSRSSFIFAVHFVSADFTMGSHLSCILRTLSSSVLYDHHHPN